MNTFSCCDFHLLEGDRSIVILDSKNLPLVVFPYCGRSADFVFHYADLFVPSIDAGFLTASFCAPARYKKRLSSLCGKDFKQRRLQVVSDFEKLF